MGVITFVGFSFWVIVAHLVFSVFLVEAGAGSESLDFLLMQLGLTMLAVGSVIGAIIALVFYATILVSLPMLVEREVDFLTAIITSWRACLANRAVLLVWAAIIAGLLFLATVAAFIGLLVVLPVLGHATWHLYKRLVEPIED